MKKKKGGRGNAGERTVRRGSRAEGKWTRDWCMGRHGRDDLDVNGGECCSDGKRRQTGTRQRNKLTAE
jgi:hypothetical protein